MLLYWQLHFKLPHMLQHWHSWIILDSLYYWWKAILCCLVRKKKTNSEIFLLFPFLVSYLERSSTTAGLYTHYIGVYSLHWAIALETIVARGIPGGSWLGWSCWQADVETLQTLPSPTGCSLGHIMDYVQSNTLRWSGKHKPSFWSLLHEVPPLH